MNLSKNHIAIKGEIIKQRKNYHCSVSSILSLLIWPLINFIYIFYTYQSFDITYLSKYGIDSYNEFVIFLITGALVYNCFWSMVQSAFYLNYERQNGTLESIIISPIRFELYFYARALGGILSSLWMFFSFSFITMLFLDDVSIRVIFLSVISLGIIAFSATVWGAFINVLFITSRDSNYLFTICDEPMKFFSGTNIPVQAFPGFAQMISFVFPATYCMNVIRTIYGISTIKYEQIVWYFVSLFILIFITIIVARVAYKKNRNDGSLNLY